MQKRRENNSIALRAQLACVITVQDHAHDHPMDGNGLSFLL